MASAGAAARHGLRKVTIGVARLAASLPTELPGLPPASVLLRLAHPVEQCAGVAAHHPGVVVSRSCRGRRGRSRGRPIDQLDVQRPRRGSSPRGGRGSSPCPAVGTDVVRPPPTRTQREASHGGAPERRRPPRTRSERWSWHPVLQLLANRHRPSLGPCRGSPALRRTIGEGHRGSHEEFSSDGAHSSTGSSVEASPAAWPNRVAVDRLDAPILR